MTINHDLVVLWDNGADKFCLYAVPEDAQYSYIQGLPCITFGMMYENAHFKGCDVFTLFDRPYMDLLRVIENAYRCLDGVFRIYDMGDDTDAFVDFTVKDGRLSVSGQLGASFSSHTLRFEFEADQTILYPFRQILQF